MKADMLKRLDDIPEAYVELFADFGPAYFNPAFGKNDAETLAKISDLSGFLTTAIAQGLNTEHPEAIEMLSRMIWSAAQASAMVNDSGEVSA